MVPEGPLFLLYRFLLVTSGSLNERFQCQATGDARRESSRAEKDHECRKKHSFRETEHIGGYYNSDKKNDHSHRGPHAAGERHAFVHRPH